MNIWREVLRRPSGKLGLMLTATLALAAIAAPLLAAYDPIVQLDLATGRLLPPSWGHPLGTDDLSRDVLSRVLFGARISLAIAVFAVTVSVIVGTSVGITAGFTGGKIDTIVMRFVDAALAVPRLLLLLVVVGLWGSVSVPVLIVMLGLTSWFETSRLVRAEVLSQRSRDYVTAARALGVPTPALLSRHILPNVMGPVIVSATLGVGQIILVEAGLSFLGIGVPRPTPSWGVMIADSQEIMVTAWWTVVFPGMAIVMAVIAFSLLGDALRSSLDPKTT